MEREILVQTTAPSSEQQLTLIASFFYMIKINNIVKDSLFAVAWLVEHVYIYQLFGGKVPCS